MFCTDGPTTSACGFGCQYCNQLIDFHKYWYEYCHCITLRSRGGFTVKLMKLKLQGPSPAWPPSKALGPGGGADNKASEMPWNLKAHMSETSYRFSPNVTTVPLSYTTLSVTRCEDERYLPKLSIIKNDKGLEWLRGFQEVKVPRFHDNGTGWWWGCQPWAPAAFTLR